MRLHFHWPPHFPLKNVGMKVFFLAVISVMMNIITYKTKMPISKLPQLHPDSLNCFHLYWTLRPLKHPTPDHPWPSIALQGVFSIPSALQTARGGGYQWFPNTVSKIHHVRVVNSYSRPLWESSFTKVKPPKKRLGEDESPGFLQAQPMDTTARLVIPKAASRKSCFAARDLNQSQSEVLLN